MITNEGTGGPRAVLNTPRSTKRLLTFAKLILAAMTSNADFPSPTPNLDAFEKDIDAFDKASSQGASLLRRAKCPACGKRGQGSLGSFMTAAGLGLSMAVLGYRQLEEAAIVLGVVMVLPLGALFAWWHTNKADSAVNWESVADLAPAARPISPGWAAQQAPPEPVQAPRWETPEPPSPPNLEPPGESSGLELDFDRSWNKKKS